MKNCTLAGKVVLRLSWIPLREILNALRQAASSKSYSSLVLVAGHNTQLCQRIEETWRFIEISHTCDETLQAIENQTSQMLFASAVAHTPLTEKTTSQSATAADLPPAEHLHLSGIRPAVSCLYLQDVEASLVVLSSEINAGMQLQAVTPQTAEEQWDITITFDPEAIAQWLQHREIIAALPNLAYLEASDLQNHSPALRQLWLQLFSLIEESEQNPKIAQLPLKSSPSEDKQPHSLSQSYNISANSDDLLFYQSPIGIFWESLDGGILKANPAFCQLIGYTEVQLRHLDVRAISHPEDFATEVRTIHALLNQPIKQQIVKKRFFCRNGSMLWTEVCLSLVNTPEPEDRYLLGFVTDLTSIRASEQDRYQHIQREALLSEISTLIRSSLDLPKILQRVVEVLQETLQSDRVVAYQLLPDRSGICVAESVEPAYPAMKGRSFSAECLPNGYLDAYHRGRFWLATDIQALDLTKCHRQMLDRVRVRSAIVAPVLLSNSPLCFPGVDLAVEMASKRLKGGNLNETSLWGLLVVHQCRMPRQWTVQEQQLVQAVANQMALAVEQAGLLQQLRSYTQELEIRVAQRTQILERSLKFEKLLRQLAQLLRDQASEDCFLQVAVTGLAGIFTPAIGQASLYDLQNHIFRACHPLEAGFEDWQWTLNPQELVECQQTQTIGLPEGGTELMSPIWDDRGLIAAIHLYCPQVQVFEPNEIESIEQVTLQCAIAIRQARLIAQERTLRSSANYFRLFLEKSVDVFIEYDPAFRCLYINPAGAALMGQPQQELMGKSIRVLLGETAEGIESTLKQVFKIGEQVLVDHEFAWGGNPRTFESLYAPILSSTGSVERVISIYRDVSESRYQWQHLQDQNHQLTAINRLKQEFIATTSHELRTPLTAIMGFSSVLLASTFGDLNPKQKDYLERIKRSGKHLLELINDILDLSRIEANRLELEPQLVFIQEICDSAIGLLPERATSQGINLVLEIEPDVEYMVTDPKRLKQILVNLLSNAVKFTPKGTVGLKVYRDPVACNSPVEMIHFLVWDTGIGISEAHQHLLFSPFSQIDSSLSRKHQGTGLGLAIARKLAELQDGTISLESRPGEGSRFTLSLPSLADPALGYRCDRS